MRIQGEMVCAIGIDRKIQRISGDGVLQRYKTNK